MPATISDPIDRRLRETYDLVLRRYQDDPAVMGVDIGRRYDAGGNVIADEYAVRVHVGDSLAEWRKSMWEKHDAQKPYNAAAVVIDPEYPAYVDRLDAYYFSHATSTQPKAFSQANEPPTSAPIEIAHRRRSGGTLGLIVVDDRGTQYILSCAHVLRGPATDKRTSILHPTFRDGGREPESVVANFDRAVDPSKGDAAVARLAEGGAALVKRFKNNPAAKVTQPVRAQIGELVMKSGVGSGQKGGVVDGVGRYFLSTPGTVGFDGFIIVPDADAEGDVSTFGDSGAVWYSARNPANGLGIHVGGAGADVLRRPAIACHLDAVLDALSVRIKPL